MIRLFFIGLVLLGVIVFEHGFLDTLSPTAALVPVSVAVGVYFSLHLRPAIGLVWLAASGLALDIHQPLGTMNVLVLTLLGWVLLFVVNQYVTHRSYYSVTILGAGYFFLWSLWSVVLRAFRANTPSIGVLIHDMLWTTILGALAVLGVTLVVAWLDRYVAPYIRFRL